MTRLREGTDGIRAVVADPRCVSIAEGVKATLMRYSLLNDSEVSSRRARDTLKKVSDLAVSLDSELTSYAFQSRHLFSIEPSNAQDRIVQGV